MSSKRPDLLDWLQITRTPDFRVAKPLGAFFGLLLILVCLSLLLFGLVGFAKLGAALFGLGSFAEDNRAEAIRNVGLLLIGLFGAPFLVWRSYVAQRQVDVAEQGQITDRINKAVEGLGSEKTVREIHEIPRYVKHDGEWLRDEEGNLVQATRPDGTPLIDRESYERTVPNLEVRIGAIYALERIAKDSLRDHIQIMEILCAYIRENAPAKNTEAELNVGDPTPRPRSDIQAAISIIGRRSEEQSRLEWNQKFRLDLRNCDLSGVDFRNRNFSAAMFHRSRFEGALFRNSKLVGTQFHASLLNFADFFGAELRGTIFDLATLNLPEPRPGGMNETINMGEIYGISLAGADVTAVDYFGEPETQNLTFGSKDTLLHHTQGFKRDRHGDSNRQIRLLRQQGDIEKAEQLEATIKNDGFRDWFPHPYRDGARGWYYSNFLDRLGLTEWPFKG